MIKYENMVSRSKQTILQNNYRRKLLIHHNKNNLLLHNLEIQITQINLHIKTIAFIVTEQMIPS